MSGNVNFGAKTDYTQKTAPFSREILEWAAQNLIGPPGPKGDQPSHEWLGTELRFQNPDGTWGNYTDLLGQTGNNAPNVQPRYSADGISWHDTYIEATDQYIQFSYDGGSTWTTAVILFKGDKGDQGDAADNVKIQYSTDGITYLDVAPDPTNYIRFSLDNGVVWQTGIYVKGDDGSDGSDGSDAPEVKIQYSIDGVAYHDTYVPGTDKYIRFSVDNGSTWLVSDRFIGTDGTNGTNAYLYIGWADDDAGNGFTMTFDPSKDYRAEVQTTSPITPVQSTFTGLWKNVVGASGADGADAYSYVAYASAIDGTGFTLVNDDALDYMAILSTPTYLNPPIQSNFAGLWFKRRGASGANASYIELPSATTVHGRIVAGIISQPVGWTMDSGDQISNPLSSNPVDLVINHGEGKEVVEVIIKSKTVDHQIKLIGAAAYSTFLDDDTKDYLCIKSFSETETIIGIYILFES